LALLPAPSRPLAFVPQVLRTWRAQSALGLSLAMISLNCTGIFLWLIYGLYTRSLPIIIANPVTPIRTSTVLILVIKYR
jgi:MtN3 and saliva related transmembrane protein